MRLLCEEADAMASAFPSAQPAAEATGAEPLSCHHIDDPLRHHDHLFGRLAIERPFYRIEGQDGRFDLGTASISGDCDIAALLTIDLDRKCDRVLDQKIRLQLRPSL